MNESYTPWENVKRFETRRSGKRARKKKSIPGTQRFVLRDGTSVCFRSIDRTDIQRLLAMHDRLSPDSIYSRYLHPYTPTTADLRRLIEIHDHNGKVVVAVTETPCESVIGVAYFVNESDESTRVALQARSAECAILVEDRYHNQGIGYRLFNYLIDQAISNGVGILHADVHLDNWRVMRLVRKLDLPVESKMTCGQWGVSIWLKQCSFWLASSNGR